MHRFSFGASYSSQKPQCNLWLWLWSCKARNDSNHFCSHHIYNQHDELRWQSCPTFESRVYIKHLRCSNVSHNAAEAATLPLLMMQLSTLIQEAKGSLHERTTYTGWVALIRKRRPHFKAGWATICFLRHAICRVSFQPQTAPDDFTDCLLKLLWSGKTSLPWKSFTFPVGWCIQVTFIIRFYQQEVSLEHLIKHMSNMLIHKT